MARKRLVPSTASSLSRASISAHPPISSLASVKGPSTTVNFPSAYVTLVASSRGASPPAASSTPALVASSMNVPISAISSGVGGDIGAEGSPIVYPKNRIALFPSLVTGRPGGAPGRACRALAPAPALSCPCVERRYRRSTPGQKFRPANFPRPPVCVRAERFAATGMFRPGRGGGPLGGGGGQGGPP